MTKTDLVDAIAGKVKISKSAALDSSGCPYRGNYWCSQER